MGVTTENITTKNASNPSIGNNSNQKGRQLQSQASEVCNYKME
jgi:hypothetical protein